MDSKGNPKSGTMHRRLVAAVYLIAVSLGPLFDGRESVGDPLFLAEGGEAVSATGCRAAPSRRRAVSLWRPMDRHPLRKEVRTIFRSGLFHPPVRRRGTGSQVGWPRCGANSPMGRACLLSLQL